MKNVAITTIINALRKKYPAPRTALHYSTPFELLVATILSAQCADERVNKVTEELFVKYPSVNDLANVAQEALEEDIRSTGFFKNKSKAIIGTANMLIDKYSGKMPDTLEELIKLPGVGRKTASVVLSCAFGIPAIAVDTHVLRVSNRVGLVASKNPDKVEMRLRELISQDDWIFYSLSIILHGRETCKAGKPRCAECVLFSPCMWHDKNK